MIAITDLNLDEYELQVIWLSLLCAGKETNVPNEVDYGHRVELTDEAQVVARKLARRVRSVMKDIIPVTV